MEKPHKKLRAWQLDMEITQGSLSELDTQLELSKRLDFIGHSNWLALDKKLVEEDKVLSGLIHSKKKFSPP